MGSTSGARPTAFVSYTHGGAGWEATVLDFATALRTVGGIDADLDKWHEIEGQDWTTYGPAAIRSSDFILLAVRPAYKAAWEGTNPSDKNPGAAREAAAIKAIFDKDQRDFRRRVKVVVLPGAGTESVPEELLATVERFEIRSFDLRGLEKLVRSILGKPSHELPVLGPLPALPPRSNITVAGEPRPGEEQATPAASSAAGANVGDRGIADALAEHLVILDQKIASGGSEPDDGDTSQEQPQARLRRERSAAKDSLDAVQRAMPIGVARQQMVGDYLNAQLYLSAGAFHAAANCLAPLRARLPPEDACPTGSALEPCLWLLTDLMSRLTERLSSQRHAAVTGSRRPQPPDMKLDRERTRSVRTFYEVARCAMKEDAATGSLGTIRQAILRGRTPPEKHAARLYARYSEQQSIATVPLELMQPGPRGDAAAAEWLAYADLHHAGDGVASDVLIALAKAHLDLHLVEHRRSVPVGKILERRKVDIDEDRRHLQRSVVLNTFALAISETLPWIFAANEEERTSIQRNAAKARRELRPAAAMWQARQVTLLSLYRRSHGFRLLGDYGRAYNDLRKLQRIGRLTRTARTEDSLVTGWVDTLEALAEYRIGELYRADHDYMQALVHLCRSHDSVKALERRQDSTIAKELGHLEIKLSLGKGKAFFEIGAMKRSLKWHLAAWRWLLGIERFGSDRGEASIEKLETDLDRVKHDPVLDKTDVEAALRPVVEQMCECRLEPQHHALAADILIRISHLLTVIRLPEDGLERPHDRDSSALRCMKRAAELDEHNLLVHTGLLRYEMRRRSGSMAKRTMPDPMLCWPSGASDVDQLIRAAEHLMLERLYTAGGPTGTGGTGVARALMAHFMTHTDSINLRGAILHRYLMRRRAEDREPWWVDAASEDDATTPWPQSGRSAPYLEFVCLRRFGSFTPFMPRPAAVSAVGGGYLLRMPRHGSTRPAMFNIVVDPGEGAVNNLYAVGLSIADIDMVVATHDHPEHLAALDAILSLRRELQKRERADPSAPEGSASTPDTGRRLLILGNRSVVNRYSFLNGDGRHLVQHLADASVIGGCEFPSDVTITALPTKHEDLGGHDANGFVLSFSPAGVALRIAFMADTAVEGLHEDGNKDNRIAGVWETALASDIVVAHVSDVPSGELRALAKLPLGDGTTASDDFDRRVATFAMERPADASQLMHALSLVPPDPGADPRPLSLLSESVEDGGEQLYLRGLLDVCMRMHDAASQADDGTHILIVGELKEQLGSFRGTIAREINRRMLDVPEDRRGRMARPLVALTADIGLRIRLTSPTSADGGAEDRRTVLCSTCSYNNDRLDMERFHAPQDIYEVCVKGDHEAMYWNCDLHDPGLRKRAMFVEQLGGYNPFAAGGRYHG